MKMIEAILPSEALGDVRALLFGQGISEFIASDIFVAPRDDNFETTTHYDDPCYLPEVKLEVAVPDERATATAHAILHAAGELSGKPLVEIMIASLEEVVRIETGERGNAAI